MFRHTLTAIPLTMAAIAIVNLPSVAAALPVWNPGTVIQQAWQDLHSILQQEIAAHYGHAAPWIQSSLDQAMGVLGSPSPQVFETQLSQVLRNQELEDLLTPVPLTHYPLIVQEMNQTLVSGQVEAVYSQTGQQRRQQQLQDVDWVLSQNQQHTESALAATSTQDAIKNIALQNARSLELLASLQVETMQVRHDALGQSLLMGDIAEQLQQEDGDEQRQRAAGAQAVLRHAASSRLY